jgi:hypothetical protein
MDRGRVGEDRGSKETDRCPLTDVVAEVALFADVTGLATVVACLRERFEGSSAVDIHRDVRRECT